MLKFFRPRVRASKFIVQFSEILIHLVMRAHIKEDNHIFKLNVNNTNISRDRESPSALQVTGQRMVIDGRSAEPSDEHIHTHLILRTKFGVFSNPLRIILYERTMKLNALHAGGIPSCF